jgi:hypothetical protein
VSVKSRRENTCMNMYERTELVEDFISIEPLAVNVGAECCQKGLLKVYVQIWLKSLSL